MMIRQVTRFIVLCALCAGMLLLSNAPATAQGGPSAGTTPAEMVATYNTLADTILGAKKTEDNLVRTILAAAYAHARGQVEHARQAIKANDAKGSQAALESLAAAVAQMGTEGDSAVGAVRKRLLEGGHHHHADGEAKGIYDEGYVVVTRVAKAAFLDSSKAFGAQARAPKADALESEWKKVEATWASLMK